MSTLFDFFRTFRDVDKINTVFSAFWDPRYEALKYFRKNVKYFHKTDPFSVGGKIQLFNWSPF